MPGDAEAIRDAPVGADAHDAVDPDVAETKRLLGAGADVSLANNYGATPMSVPAMLADPEITLVVNTVEEKRSAIVDSRTIRTSA